MKKQINKKNIFYFLISTIIIFVIFFNFQKNDNVAPLVIETIPNEEQASLPKKLIIPKINVEAEIEEVGITNEGKMGIPEIPENVAWYKFGAIPGATGNAVIAGHLDNFLGLPLVFWDLDKLEIGDDIYVIAEDGTESRFKVTGKELYDHDYIETENIFGPTDKKHLNLITCDGLWLQDIKNYNKRLVIFSEAF